MHKWSILPTSSLTSKYFDNSFENGRVCNINIRQNWIEDVRDISTCDNFLIKSFMFLDFTLNSKVFAAKYLYGGH